MRMQMMNLRKYGNPPFRAAVIHGGPGAGGEMAPVARELAADRGILEPIQTAPSLEGQVDELRRVLEDNGTLPVTLIGYSWGAWLSFILAARVPAIINKLILVASGPFEEKYVPQLLETRLSRLKPEEQTEFKGLISALSDPTSEDRDFYLSRLGALASKSDEFDPMEGDIEDDDAIGPQGDLFQAVWSEAEELRRSGALLELGRDIRCPVVAIHGDYDPHPAEGVEKPLASVLEEFRFHLLEHCGHKPWREWQARDEFFRILKEELG